MTQAQKLNLRAQVYTALTDQWLTLAQVEAASGVGGTGEVTCRLLLHDLKQAGVVEHDTALNQYRRTPKRK